MNVTDICVNCGELFKCEYDDPECGCSNPKIMHLWKCCRCDNLVAIKPEDPYVGIDKVYCSECLKKLKNGN